MTPASLLPPSPAVRPLALRPQQLSAGNGDRGRPEVTSQPAPSLSPGLGQAQSSYQLLSAAAELCSRASTGYLPPPQDIFPPPFIAESRCPWGGEGANVGTGSHPLVPLIQLRTQRNRK